jgi:arylsulfatase A-like enzyme
MILRFLKSTLLLGRLVLCLTLLHVAACPLTAAERPNILFILMDDMGWRDAGCYGSTYYETPNIDRLAREGMRFTNAYVNAPVCTPSRACIISGQSCPRHGIYIVSPDPSDAKNWDAYRSSIARRPLVPVENNKTLPASVVGLPAALKPAGYVTAFTGKWHHRPDPTALGFDQHLRPSREKDDPKNIFSLTEQTIKFLREHRDRPFFFYLSHHAPHVPVEAREATIARFHAKSAAGGHNNPEYAAMMADADEGIGIVLDELDKLKLTDRTIVVLFSDNGGFLRFTSVDPLRGGKGQFYEGGIRVPLIVRWPGSLKAGTVCHEPVIGTDLYPTLLELAGTSRRPNHALDGLSVVPLLRGQSSLDREAIFWHQPLYTFGFDQAPCSVIRAGDYKLIEFFEDQHLELYDLSNDMGEQVNLAASMPDRARELHEQLQDWRASLHAPLPRPRAGREAAKPKTIQSPAQVKSPPPGHAHPKNSAGSEAP